MRNNLILQIGAAISGLITVILYGTMTGERTNLFTPVLALLIIGFLFITVITFGRTIFDVDDDFPVILLGINLGSALFLVIALIIFIVAMVQGGPVILDSMEFIPQQFQSGSCTASQWTEDTSFCRTNPTQCAQDREECYRLIDSNGTAVNHHCNAAMAFTIITVLLVVGVIIGQYQYMREPYEEENDINTGLDPRGLPYSNGNGSTLNGTKKAESKVFIENKRELDSPRPSAFI